MSSRVSLFSTPSEPCGSRSLTFFFVQIVLPFPFLTLRVSIAIITQSKSKREKGKESPLRSIHMGEG